MNVLVTGGAGFIGSNFINLFIDHTSINKIVCVDSMSYAGTIHNLRDEVVSDPRFNLVRDDINNTQSMIDAINSHSIDCIIHMAAESHVDNSISTPLVFAKTNALGTMSMLEAARTAWQTYEGKRFVYVSTDEVYGSIKEGSFTEKSPYQPNSPYSASKAAGDMFCRAYYETYKLPVIVTHCSNNYGRNQHEEKFIPTIIRSIKNGKKVPVYGNGSNIRNWIHVEDHCYGIMSAAISGKPGETYNFGGSVELTNLQIVQTICEVSSTPFENVVEFVEDRKGHDFRYSVDSSKAQRELGWYDVIPFSVGIDRLIKHSMV